MRSLSLFYAQILDGMAKDIPLYENDDYSSENNLPFLVSGAPFKLTLKEREDINDIGIAIKELFDVAKTHYQKSFDTFFFRPDILLTDNGYKICEIEAQPFGFGLVVFLIRNFSFFTSTFGKSSKQLLVDFIQYWFEKTNSNSGIFVYTDHTKKFKGQIEYLVSLLNVTGGDFFVKNVKDLTTEEIKTNNFYRAFYTYEKDYDDDIKSFLKMEPKIFPQIDTYFETKNLLSDVCFNKQLRDKISKESLNILDKFLLKTWKIEKVVPESFPLNIKKWDELIELPKGQRKFVIKLAGNHPNASWARSVIFLHKKSQVQLKEIFENIMNSSDEWLIQEFFDYKEIEVEYASEDFSHLDIMEKGRARLTPYYRYQTGELLGAKITVRKNTLLIHAASDSINTVVS